MGPRWKFAGATGRAAAGACRHDRGGACRHDPGGVAFPSPERRGDDRAGDDQPLPFRRAPQLSPDEAIGAAFDGAMKGEIDRQLAPGQRPGDEVRGAAPVDLPPAHRARIEAWHWNPVGRGAIPPASRVIGLRADQIGAPIQLSWGYKLPRRGDSGDNANNDDYSRLTDGDPDSFWKSNPYLDPDVLEDGEPHPQWPSSSSNKPQPVNAAVIDWATPYATRYQGAVLDQLRQIRFGRSLGRLRSGAGGTGRGGRAVLSLAKTPVRVQFVRVLLLASSHTAPAGSTDWRDRMGYAVREVSFGLRGPDGRFTDFVRHPPLADRSDLHPRLLHRPVAPRRRPRRAA